MCGCGRNYLSFFLFWFGGVLRESQKKCFNLLDKRNWCGEKSIQRVLNCKNWKWWSFFLFFFFIGLHSSVAMAHTSVPLVIETQLKMIWGLIDSGWFNKRFWRRTFLLVVSFDLFSLPFCVVVYLEICIREHTATFVMILFGNKTQAY